MLFAVQVGYRRRGVFQCASSRISETVLHDVTCALYCSLSWFFDYALSISVGNVKIMRIIVIRTSILLKYFTMHNYASNDQCGMSCLMLSPTSLMLLPLTRYFKTPDWRTRVDGCWIYCHPCRHEWQISSRFAHKNVTRVFFC